ncbi:TPA: hypothetical protein JLI26_003540 [Escherichia coli]|nr:MAG TPA: tail completion protein [Caudoviricetes sp.]HAW0071993.1 hypothetical protein [Escherichia coli]HCP5916535.1 hypothetical protein [Escherichia coli]
MIELALKTSLERLTGLVVYPLLLPDKLLEGVTYQRISDPEIEVGLVRTGLVTARFQITLYLTDDYTGLLRLDQKIWRAWRPVVHGQIEGFPVQYVARGSIQQDKNVLTSGSVQYRLARDFFFTYAQSADANGVGEVGDENIR